MKFRIILCCLMFAGCNDLNKTTNNHNTEITVPPQSLNKTTNSVSNNLNTENTSTISSDVPYSIVSTDILPGIKRSLTVRLEEKIPEEELRDLALKLKNQDSRNYERTFISYILPGMKENAGAWATTHFDPELEVNIIGLTVEEENTLVQIPNDTTKEVIGNWLNDNLPTLGSRITIYRQGDKIYMQNTYSDGSVGQNEVIEKSSTKGKAFERKERNTVGEYYLIDKEGDLQFWDEEGFIFTAKKI